LLGGADSGSDEYIHVLRRRFPTPTLRQNELTIMENLNKYAFHITPGSR
jgi:hypothetical protein